MKITGQMTVKVKQEVTSTLIQKLRYRNLTGKSKPQRKK